MKQELSLWQRFRAPIPKSIVWVIIGSIIIALDILWGRVLLYFNNETPDLLYSVLFIIAWMLLAFSLGLCFTVDEDAQKKASVLDNIKPRKRSRV